MPWKLRNRASLLRQDPRNSPRNSSKIHIFVNLGLFPKSQFEKRYNWSGFCFTPSSPYFVSFFVIFWDVGPVWKLWCFFYLLRVSSFFPSEGLDFKCTWSGVMGLKNLMNYRSILLRTRDYSYTPWINFYELGPKSLSKTQLIFHE